LDAYASLIVLKLFMCTTVRISLLINPE